MSQTTEIVITGGTVVDQAGERSADVRVVDGIVSEVGDGLSPGDGVSGCLSKRAGRRFEDSQHYCMETKIRPSSDFTSGADFSMNARNSGTLNNSSRRFSRSS